MKPRHSLRKIKIIMTMKAIGFTSKSTARILDMTPSSVSLIRWRYRDAEIDRSLIETIYELLKQETEL